MKKTIFTILWMLAFFVIGLIVFGVFAYAMVQSSPHPTDPASFSVTKVRLIMLVDWLCPIGLPILALILGILGKLPGTHGRKDLVQT
jgi:heme/copper-type cytochrome/quinol oxidase subunit 2